MSVNARLIQSSGRCIAGSKSPELGFVAHGCALDNLNLYGSIIPKDTMTVYIRYLHNDEVEQFRGEPEQLVHQLLAKFPWASRDPFNDQHNSYDLQHVLQRIGRAQNLYVTTQE